MRGLRLPFFLHLKSARGIFAGAKTGYVALRVEPGGQAPPVSPLTGFQRLSDAYRANALAAWLTALRGPFSASQTHQNTKEGQGWPAAVMWADRG